MIYNILALAALAAASPVIDYETVLTTNFVYVTAGQEPAPTTTAVATAHPQHSGNDYQVITRYNIFTYVIGPNGELSSSEVPVTTAVPTVDAVSSSAPAPQATSSAVAAAPEKAANPSIETSSAPAATSATEAATSSAAAPAQSADSSLDSFAQDVVNYHNKVRADHDASSVTWNSTLADFAQNYLNGNCNFAHSGGPYGENIAMGYSTTDDALDAWYNEDANYNYAAAQFGEDTGHFTQMVWKGTNQVGCAQTNCANGAYLVCEYYPRGNIIGEFAENVVQ